MSPRTDHYFTIDEITRWAQHWRVELIKFHDDHLEVTDTIGGRTLTYPTLTEEITESNLTR